MEILNRFDLNLLVVFEAVYTEGGVSRAADRLCLTQSAVSHSLRRLRDVVGDPLFTRKVHQMIPNSTADRLIGPVRSALRQVATSLASLSSFDPATSMRRFRIGVRGFAEAVILPTLFSAVRRTAPLATFEVVTYDRAALPTLLGSRSIDIALDTGVPHGGPIAAEKLGGIRFVAMLRTSHPALKSEFDIEHYLALQHVVVSTRRSGLGFEDAALRGLVRERDVVLRCQNYTTAALVVSTSDLVLTAPLHFAKILLGQVDMDLVDIFPDGRLHYSMYSHAESVRDPAITWLREAVGACAAEVNAATSLTTFKRGLGDAVHEVPEAAPDRCGQDYTDWRQARVPAAGGARPRRLVGGNARPGGLASAAVEPLRS